MAAAQPQPAQHDKATSASFCRHCGAPQAESHRFCPSCGAAAGAPADPVDPMIGRAINGAYVIEALIGVGGMGRIYRAEQTALGRPVAIKVVNPLLLANDQAVARFYREARAASALNHPNSVSVIDFGRAEDGTLFMVMELLRGRDLSALVAAEGLPSLGRCCRILIDVLSALGEAHASGVVHRDLKPDNIFIEQRKSGRDLVKVLDFGIATLAAEQSTCVTLPGIVCGTPQYMSPEQVTSGEIDGRSDLYAAGAVLFELLTGRPVFSGESASEVASHQVNTPPPDPRAVAPERQIPDALARLVLRALAKRKDERFADAGEMSDALREIAAELEPRVSRISSPYPSPQAPQGAARAAGPGAARIETLAAPPSPAPAEASGVRAARTPSSRPGALAKRPLLGREVELAKLEALLERARKQPVFVQLTGDIGVGKTRLLRELTARARAAGFRVASAGPHDSHAPVAYGAARALLSSLWEKSETALVAHAATLDDAFARAGIAEALGTRPSVRGEPVPLAPAVARALAAGARANIAAHGQPLLLALDDAQLCDGASLAALDALPQLSDDLPLLLCLSSQAPVGAQLPARGEVLALEALPEARARFFADDGAAGDSARELGEAISRRLDRLGPESRRALQAAAVLGMRCTPAALAQLLQTATEPVQRDLVAAGWLEPEAGELVFGHPYVRDLVLAATPAGVREQLHARALATTQDAPLEVRALHASETSLLVQAAMLLEETGTAARDRGDLQTALWAYRRGHALARRQAQLDDNRLVAGTLVTMSRGLVAALALQGDLANAEGVLREDLSSMGGGDTTRLPLLVDLAAVLLRRGDHTQARDLLVQVLLQACAARAREVEAAAHATLADCRHAAGDYRGEIAALLSAQEALAKLGTHPLLECRVALRLGAAMLRAGDVAGGANVLAHAEELAKRAGARSLAARALLGRMAAEAAQFDIRAAQQRGREARRLAAEAGDLALGERIDAAMHALVRKQPLDPLLMDLAKTPVWP